ncbi:MAG: phosphatidate cytidylyltransferase [Bacteroidetes bacterium]|nr:phosphatidate cytidylyltransferase [Bacteroidota bacterium]
MKNLLLRSLSGIIYLAVLIAAIMYNEYSFTSVITVISAICALELAAMLKNRYPEFRPFFITFVIPAISIFTYLCFAGYLPLVFIFSLLLLIPLVFVSQLYITASNPFILIGLQLMAWLYLAIPFILIYFMVFNPLTGFKYKPDLLIGYLILLWANDTLAYITGRLIGKRKLFERISPKKTWEGFIGGTIATFVLAWFMADYIPIIDKMHWLVIAFIVAVFGVWGDLVESLFKRSSGIKDSGFIIPGHGGMLDRFDSVLFSLPVVVLYLFLIIYL